MRYKTSTTERSAPKAIKAMAEDVVWRPMVGGVWGDVHHGWEQARDNLFAPLRKQHANTTSNTFAAGDAVIVEAQGAVRPNSGKAYNNRYCFVIEMVEGQMKEVRE